MTDLRSELTRRKTNTRQVLALLQSRPLQWVGWQEIAKVGGACAWRTRIADARKIARNDGGDIVWNRQRSSAYMFKPFTPLGPDAGTPRPSGWLFDVHERG